MRGKTRSVDDVVQVGSSVVVVLTNEKTGKKRTFMSRNIVTNAGDLYYSERCVLLTTGTPIGPVPTNFTDTNGVPDMIMELYDNTPANNAPAKGNDRSDLLGTIAPSSSQPMDATYPLVNDPDADNTGSGTDIITYRRSYTSGQANLADITDLILTNPSPGASEPVIMHAEFPASFGKTSDDTLKVFVNHRINGT